ncbi:GlxA family transcriptional regulator [Radicibacter daui]|uniref:GlxA family transcriptional regulator n=1 Tax=Radicibacter daui TaxID=3064829 RepID=UPI004046BD84
MAKAANKADPERPVTIGILAYPGAQAAAVHGLADLFAVASRLALVRETEAGETPLRCFTVTLWRLPEGEGAEAPIPDAAFPAGSPSAPDVIILPPSLDRSQAYSAGRRAITDWLTGYHRSGALMCSVCAGAFLLAEAGLLDGRAATTHWALADELARRFPKVSVNAGKLLVEEAGLITAGGVMAWTDLGLRLVERFMGRALMLEVARFFLIDPSGREQSFYSSFRPAYEHGDEPVLKVQRWLEARRGEKLDIAGMAAEAGLGERTFLRRFSRATGLTPTDYLQRLRIERARGLLEATARPVEQVAFACGYEDAGAFRKLFQRLVGLTPGDYRQRFQPRL